jgi:hypothetical protein
LLSQVVVLVEGNHQQVVLVWVAVELVDTAHQ